MEKELNKKVAGFHYNNRKYEVDLLLDSINNGFQSYDIFDVTDEETSVAQFELKEGDYMTSEIIRHAKLCLDNLDD